MYLSGMASDPKRSLSGNNNSHFLNNKCLVIKGIGKQLGMGQLKHEINVIAGRRINYLYDPVILSKITQNTRTIVFELNEGDYDILSNPQLWDNTVKVAEFVGNRFWRKNNAKYSHTQMSNLVKDSWN